MGARRRLERFRRALLNPAAPTGGYCRPAVEQLEARTLLYGAFSIEATSPGQEPALQGQAAYADFTVTLNLVTNDPAPGSVTWTALTGAGDTATAGDDYTALGGTLNFPSGVGSQTISIPILYDQLAEGSETFRVVLTDPTGGNLIDVATASGEISDNAVPTVSVVATATIDEATTGEFVFSRSTSVGSLMVYYEIDASSTAAETDYDSALTLVGGVTFLDGQSEVHVPVDAIDDTLLENMETLIVEILTYPAPNPGPVNYQIGTGTAQMEIHDGEHGVVDALFAVEWEDEDNWKPAPDTETLWTDVPIRWLPEIPQEIVEDVAQVIWLKRPRDIAGAAWEPFAAAGFPAVAIGDPDAGDWDIKFRAEYGTHSWFESLARHVAANKITSVYWEEGGEGQEFRVEGDQSIVFPEIPLPTSTIVEDKVKLVVTLKVAPPDGVTTVVKLKVFDPDHAHNPGLPQPVDPAKRFDPNDDVLLDPVQDVRKPNDNRHTAGGFGGASVGGTLLETSLTFLEGQQSKWMQFKIDDAQPGNNFVAVASAVKVGQVKDGIDRVKFKEEDGKTLIYSWKEEDKLLPPDFQTLTTLTVWRTLWVELDSMIAPDPALHGPFDQAADDPEYDKDLGELPNPDISLLDEQFRPANIEVRVIPALPYLAGHDLKDNRFFYHYIVEAPETPGGTDGPSTAAADVRDSSTTEQFWAIHFVGAYELNRAEDFDGDMKWNLGASIHGTNTGYILFEEIRDRAAFAGSPVAPATVPEATLLIRVPLHEAGHLMGASHGIDVEDGIMNPQIAHYNANDALAVFTEKHYAIFQSKSKPGIPAPPPGP
jgi:hypothetical protein